MINALYNRQQMRRYNWLRLWLEERLYELMHLPPDDPRLIKVTDKRWQAYQALMEAAEMMSYRYFEKHLENI